MFNKLLPKSPWGIALTTAAVVLYASPETRKAVRKAAVKGLSAIMALTEQIKESASSMRNEVAETAREEKEVDRTDHTRGIMASPLTYNTNIAPEDFLKRTEPLNVINDEFLKKQAIRIPTKLH
ncbi:hypothetical protein PP175_01370 [Aneurinibacillus sp. Ricciae_BoGa-3]|uniref:hypothetical protein n=1 Tax=Aneurinibacillus sp. Ricciae_BoGa-3 TaxID=3022697 RepID=UPI0023411FB4|nr:hypothetical protein [Aneurinibacillus sp. Ricciae_BoGa-3]WCK54718.1 hypothetical protein PP175_01370 [Aneurinibacillus sp. Ricciae_BoGa-3]